MAARTFDPHALLQDWTDEKYNPVHSGKTFEQCIRAAFNIPKDDNYVYRAQGETTLAMTQKAIGGKRIHGMHDWYHDENGNLSDPPHPTPDEISAYVGLFSPCVSLPKALNSFKASSKPSTLRGHVSSHLHSRLYNTTAGLIPSKKDRSHTNPYLSLWAYSAEELEWAGPWPNTVHTIIAHHILPVFYHHFGCVVPTYAALQVIAKLAQPDKPSKEDVRPVLDIGSGNGYWTFMLRAFPLSEGMKALDIRPIDNALSEYRINWVEDTVREDGMGYLKRNDGGKGCVLLLVYPQATGNFTGPMLKAFKGDSIVVAGTQNKNGFTAFQDIVVDEWVEKNLSEFGLTLRMPLPSFAGKDEALFVFQRKTGPK